MWNSTGNVRNIWIYLELKLNTALSWPGHQHIFCYVTQNFANFRAPTPHLPDKNAIKYRVSVPPVQLPAQPTTAFSRYLASVKANSDQFARLQQITHSSSKAASKYNNTNNGTSSKVFQRTSTYIINYELELKTSGTEFWTRFFQTHITSGIRRKCRTASPPTFSKWRRNCSQMLVINV